MRQELQRELRLARELEKKGLVKKAALHYLKVGAIYRKLGYDSPKEKAELNFNTATQYENLGKTIRSGPVKNIEKISPDIYENMIENLIIRTKPDTVWDDIGGLADVKRTIKEAIILPFIQHKPEFVKSTRTILLYGPPGTGKTLLAKASSNTLNASFFEARASSLLSKYFGESGKLVNALFNKARKLQPSVIFIDELDSIAVSRGADTNEASRRVLSQLLTEIEGFSTSKEEKVLIIGATNKPWDLDDAAVSRFQRKIYVPLPDEKARKSIFKIHLKGVDLSGINLEELVEKTEGFSGRDVANLCQEAVVFMVREMNPDLEKLTSKQVEIYSLRSRGLSLADFEHSFDKIKPASKNIEKYEEWGKEFGG